VWNPTCLHCVHIEKVYALAQTYFDALRLQAVEVYCSTILSRSRIGLVKMTRSTVKRKPVQSVWIA
jgi:hypothetical protein